MRAGRGIIFISLFFILLISTLVISSQNELNKKIRDVSNQIAGRVKNIELIQDFIVGMPALRGAIEFQSFGQIDVVVKRMMDEESLIKEFFILDKDLQILHTIYKNYQEATDTKEILQVWDKKSPYGAIHNSVYLFKKTNDDGEPAFVVMRLDVGDSFSARMNDEGVTGIVAESFDKVKLKDKFSVDVHEGARAGRSFFINYLKENVLAYAVILILLLIAFEILMRLLVKPFQRMVYLLQNLSSGEVQTVEIGQFPRLFRPFILDIIDANKKIISANQKEREIEFQKFQLKVAQQVAHDIRSPLGVLKSLRKDLIPKTEVTKRGLQSSLNRIEEIILSLLKTNDHMRIDLEDKSEDLLSLLENVLIEKKVEFRNQENVDIESDFTNFSYGLHSHIRPSYLKRIISNLINNSVEATADGHCHITVSLNPREGKNVIEITDNGPGIAEELLPHIFEKGFTTKQAGNGLGLSGAKEEIERIGGKIEVESILGQGTTVRIVLLPSKKSAFLADKIDLYKYKKVIVLDDDFSIHTLWDSKLSEFKSIIEHLYSPTEFLKKYQKLEDSVLLLSDFEFVNDKQDGIDVISRLGHKNHSILVTARSEEQEIRERCYREKISFISKTLLPYIDINIKSPHIVLIDDDDLSHWRWKKICEERAIRFNGFHSIKDFISFSDQFESDVRILLDSDLGNGLRGEVDGEEIYKRGFLKIYLYTSYPDGSLEKPSWIKDVVGKDPESVLALI